MTKYEIEIPDGVIPEGWKPKSFGPVEEDEVYLAQARCAVKVAVGDFSGPRLVLERILTPTVEHIGRQVWCWDTLSVRPKFCGVLMGVDPDAKMYHYWVRVDGRRESEPFPHAELIEE